MSFAMYDSVAGRHGHATVYTQIGGAGTLKLSDNIDRQLSRSIIIFSME